VGVEVLSRHHAHDTGRRERFFDIDVLDLRVRVWASHDVEIEHPRKLDVVDETPTPLDEPRIFFPANGVA